MTAPIAVHRYGERAVLIETGPGAVTGWSRHLRSAPWWDDLIDVVPAAATIMVSASPEVIERVLRWPGWSRPPAATDDDATDDDADLGDPIVIEVRYDGPDLDEVARTSGLTVAEVIAAHSEATYRVQFCGFAPGFSYLTGVHEALRVPRRATPRTVVPAGSVAIAGGYTAVYPTASPGGWHLLGRRVDTGDNALFDPRRFDDDGGDPCLLPPGATVRFVASDRSS